MNMQWIFGDNMAIYLYKQLGKKLVKSEDRRDKRICRFLKEHEISKISYKEYKYMYFQMQCIEMAKYFGGTIPKTTDELLYYSLSGVREDKKIENWNTGNVKFDNVPTKEGDELFTAMLLERCAKSFSDYLDARKYVAEALGKVFVVTLGQQKNEKFWIDFSYVGAYVDTLADIPKDVFQKIIRVPTPASFVKLLSNIVKHTKSTLRNIGFSAALKYFIRPTIMTIKGGIERDSQKDKPREIPLEKIESLKTQNET